MSLPILNITREPGRDDLLRFFHRTQLHWARHVGEETQFDFGTAIVNAQLNKSPYFNQVLDAFVPEGSNAATVIAQAEQHFKEFGAECRRWVLAPSAPELQTKPLAEALKSRGFTPSSFDMLYVNHQPVSPVREVSGLTIIPGRASYKHARQLAGEWAADCQTPELAESTILHLDGDHTDALIALKEGKPVAMVFVLAVGDIGCIEDVFVSAAFRNQGIGRTMMSRAMEICARSLFKHVFIGADLQNKAAGALYSRFGFKKIGDYVSYARP